MNEFNGIGLGDHIICQQALHNYNKARLSVKSKWKEVRKREAEKEVEVRSFIFFKTKEKIKDTWRWHNATWWWENYSELGGDISYDIMWREWNDQQRYTEILALVKTATFYLTPEQIAWVTDNSGTWEQWVEKHDWTIV